MPGVSDLDDIKPLVDSLNAVLAGQATAIEWTAKPRRWATGLELTEKPRVDEAGEPVLDENDEQIIDTVSPIAVGPDMITLDNENAKVGQLPGAALDGFTNAANLIVQNIMMVTSLPAHFCGITTANPSTAEAILAAESGLTSRSEAKARMLSKPWEAAARMIWAIRAGVDVDSVQVRVLFGDPSARSLAGESDAAQKLYASGILSRTAILRRLGMTNDEIAAEALEHPAGRSTRTGHRNRSVRPRHGKAIPQPHHVGVRQPTGLLDPFAGPCNREEARHERR